jgi:hypothetical protein
LTHCSAVHPAGKFCPLLTPILLRYFELDLNYEVFSVVQVPATALQFASVCCGILRYAPENT